MCEMITLNERIYRVVQQGEEKRDDDAIVTKEGAIVYVREVKKHS